MKTDQKKIVIRPTRRSDAAAIVKLGDEFAAYLTQKGDQCQNKLTVRKFVMDGFGPKRYFSGYVAKCANTLCGYILFHPSYTIEEGRRICRIIDLYVTTHRRHQGIGHALIQAAMNEARLRKMEDLEWTVSKFNKPAIDFYLALGARHIEEEQLMRLKLRK